MKQEPAFIAWESDGCLSGEPFSYDAKPVPLYRKPKELSDEEILNVYRTVPSNFINFPEETIAFARAILKNGTY